MAQYISRLGVLLGLNAAEFNAGIEQAKGKMKDFKKSSEDIRTSTLALKTSLAELAGGFGLLTTIGIGAAVTAAVQYSGQMKDISEATGVSLSYVNKFSDALAKSGGKAEDATAVFNKMAAALSAAQSGLGPERVALLSAGLTDADVAAGNLEESLGKVLEYVEGLDRVKQIEVLKQLGLQKSLGTIGFDDLLTKLGTSTEEFNELAEAQERVDKAGKSAEAIIKSITNSVIETLGPIANLLASLQNVTSSVGQIGAVILVWQIAVKSLTLTTKILTAALVELAAAESTATQGLLASYKAAKVFREELEKSSLPAAATKNLGIVFDKTAAANAATKTTSAITEKFNTMWKTILGQASKFMASLTALLSNPVIGITITIGLLYGDTIAEWLAKKFNPELVKKMKELEESNAKYDEFHNRQVKIAEETQAQRELNNTIREKGYALRLANSESKITTIELQRQLSLAQARKQIEDSGKYTPEEKNRLIGLESGVINAKANKELNDLKIAENKKFNDLIAQQEINAATGTQAKILTINKEITDYRIEQEKIYGVNSKQTSDNVIRYSKLKWDEFRRDQLEEERKYNQQLLADKQKYLDDLVNQEVAVKSKIRGLKQDAVKADTPLSRGFFETNEEFTYRSNVDKIQKDQSSKLGLAQGDAKDFANANTTQLAGESDIEFLSRWEDAYREFYDAKRKMIEQDTSTLMTNLETQRAMENKFTMDKLRDQVSSFASQSEQFKDNSVDAFNLWKTLKISEAVINGYSAALNAYTFGASFGGPIGGAAMAALSVAFTTAQIAAITQTQYQGKKLGGEVAGGQPIIVGDGGKPEIFTPYTSGKISQLSNNNNTPQILPPIINVTVNPGASFDKQVLGVLNSNLKKLYSSNLEAQKRATRA